jgi:hypothetical protein
MRRLPIIVLFLALVPTVSAQELLPADRPMEATIDHYIDSRLQDEGIKPAAPADDATVIRRLTLDLVGRIPTLVETQAYIASTDPAKKTKLVERLLASPGFVRHLTNELDAMLMGEQRASVRNYLAPAVAENRSWDRIFRELLLADESDPAQKGAGEFLRPRLNDLDRLTNDVSVLFFGVNVSCAQCHDHPLVHDWKQDHFFGMKGFFARTFDSGGFVGEREFGVVKFTPNKGKEKQAALMFLSGKTIEVPNLREPTAQELKQEKERIEQLKKNKTPPPRPSFSARAKLVEVSLQPDQREFFARALVNRTWYRLFGYGLVMPLDQMHSENPASHPELLAWLARDTAEHGYDLRRLIRGLVLSKAYARGSRWDGESDAPQARLFAVARLRPLTPMQLALSLRVAAADPQSFAADVKPEEVEKRLETLETGARGLAGLFPQPGENFQVGVGEALLFSNSDRIQKEVLADGTDRLLGRLKLIQDPKQLVETAVGTVLCRTPDAEEATALAGYLRERADRPSDACRQMVWALLTSAEFRFNH